MIQIPPASIPAGAFGRADPSDPADAREAPSADVTDSVAAANADVYGTAGTDPVAKFGASFGAVTGLHPGVQQFAYAAPDETGGDAGQAGGDTTGGSAAVTAQSAKPDAARAEAQAWMTRGVTLLQAHRYNEALEAFQEGFLVYPDPKFILNEAAALLDSGRFAEAVLAYDRYLADPNAERADEARAAQERARAALGGREATSTGVAESQRLYEEGAKAFQAGRFQDALDDFEAAYELNPVAAFRFNQAACLEKLGRPYAAADRYEAYVKAAPGSADAAKVTAQVAKLRAQADAAPITATGAAGGQEWMSRGNLLLFAHRYDEALEAFQEGFRTYPDEKFILNEAAALSDGGRYSEADLAYSRYLANPNAPRADEARAAQQRARAHVGGHEANAGDLKEAQRAFDRGSELYKAGRYADALEAFDKAYTLHATPEIRYNQAACLEKLGYREAAANRYNEYVHTRPHAPDAERTRTHAAKLHEEARKLAEQAFDRGTAAFNAGNFRDAAIAFREAYEQLPLPQFLFNVASSLDRAGETANAVREYQRYLNELPDAADADRVHKRIDTLQKATGTELMKP